MLYCKSLLPLLRCDTGKVRDRCGGKGGFKCKGWVSCVITNVITYINYSCNYILVFLKYKYNVKTCMSIVSNYSFQCKYMVLKAT